MKRNITKIVGIFLVLIFLALYFTQVTGYYEYRINKKTALTEESIKQFEQDIKNKKAINTKKYKTKDTDYNNKVSRATLKVSNRLGTVVNKTVKYIFKSISKVID